jgi:hypothetical protein
VGNVLDPLVCTMSPHTSVPVSSAAVKVGDVEGRAPPADGVRDQRVFLGFGKAENSSPAHVFFNRPWLFEVLKVLPVQQALFDHSRTVTSHHVQS